MSYEGNLDDSNVLDTLDFGAILRNNAGLARMVEHHTNMKVSEAVADALETAEDFDAGYEAGENNANASHEVTLRPSKCGRHILASNGHDIDAEAARVAYRALQRGDLAIGQDVDGYKLKDISLEFIHLGCTTVSREEVEYLALAMGWKERDGIIVPDYQSGYEAGVQSMRDRLAGVLDATVTRNG
jgi:hypothetical protein